MKVEIEEINVFSEKIEENEKVEPVNVAVHMGEATANVTLKGMILIGTNYVRNQENGEEERLHSYIKTGAMNRKDERIMVANVLAVSAIAGAEDLFKNILGTEIDKTESPYKMATECELDKIIEMAKKLISTILGTDPDEKEEE